MFVIDDFAEVFDSSGFPARWWCGLWIPTLGWLHTLSDLRVWAAYFAIPIVLGFFALCRKSIPFRGVFIPFGLFIMACGTTHLMDAIIFWWPAYRLEGIIKFCTAIISWATVIALIRAAPRALAMRTPAELEREVAERKQIEMTMRESELQLLRTCQQLN